MSVGCLGTEQRAFKKRQWDVDQCICRWKELLEGWASLSKVERASVFRAPLQSAPTHTHLTSSHHYRHHRLHLIKDFPPWLTPRLPVLLKKRGGAVKQTWPMFVRISFLGNRLGEWSPRRKRETQNLTGKGAGMQQRGKVAKPYSLYALFITMSPGWQGCAVKNAL